MFTKLAFFHRRLIRQQIEIATSTLYSEHFDFDSLVARLSQGNDGLELLRVYAAIQTAAELTDPITDDDVERTLVAVTHASAPTASALFASILEIHKELAHVQWMTRNVLILRGKLAHKQDQESFAGFVYQLEFSNKGPVRKAELEELQSKQLELDEAVARANEDELDALRQSTDPEDIERLEALECERIEAEIRTNEDASSDLELQDILSALRSKLANLLTNSASGNTRTQHRE